MTLITLASIKGSPGVTTLACLVGATWPTGRRVIVAERDSDGGDLASRFSLSTKTGWQSLALAARRGETDHSIDSHLQNLPGGLEVLVGTQGGGSDGVGRGAGKEAIRTVLEVAMGPSADVIVDLGRLHYELPETQMWLKHSATVCIVLRPDAASIGHVRDRAATVKELCGGDLLLAMVGNGSYSAPEVGRFTGVTDIIEIADDSGAAAVLTAARGSERRLARSALVKSSRLLALRLAGSEPELDLSSPTQDEADLRSPDDTSSPGLPHDGLLAESPTGKGGAQKLDRSLSLQDHQ
jgi:MinD-like ATPase involved in chromosome partitioning or flagellar assembly